MKLPYNLLEWIIKLEIILIFLLIIITFISKFYFNFKAKRNQRISNEIEKHLTLVIEGKTPLNAENFSKQWRDLNILLLVMFKIDNTINTSVWTEIKETIADIVLLPIAREKYKSRIWMNRLLSTQCFELWMSAQDENEVCKLLEDKIPLIHLHATIAAIKFSSEKLINLVINIMSARRRLGQAVYLKIFEIAPPQTKDIVENRLKAEKDFFVRATCYKILMELKDYNAILDIDADIYSTNMELRLSAMRYTSLANKDHAIPLLIKLLQDPQWEIRAASNRLLGDLHATKAIPEITNTLKDKNWWVRVNAANTLKNFGEEGLMVLNAQDPKKDKYAYETAMHVLNKTIAK